MERSFSQCWCTKRRIWNKVLAYGHPKDDETKIYQVLEIETIEKMQAAMQDPELAKLRTDAGVDLDSQELVFLVE